MSISHTYRSYEVIERGPCEFEVPVLGMTLPSEAAAHKAIDADLASWLDSYSRAVGTPSAPVDASQ